MWHGTNAARDFASHPSNAAWSKLVIDLFRGRLLAASIYTCDTAVTPSFSRLIGIGRSFCFWLALHQSVRGIIDELSSSIYTRKHKSGLLTPEGRHYVLWPVSPLRKVFNGPPLPLIMNVASYLQNHAPTLPSVKKANTLFSVQLQSRIYTYCKGAHKEWNILSYYMV